MQDKINSISSQNFPTADTLPGEQSVVKNYLALPTAFLKNNGEKTLTRVKNTVGRREVNRSQQPQQNQADKKHFDLMLPVSVGAVPPCPPSLAPKKHFYLMLSVSFLCLSLGTAGCVVVLDEKNFPKLPNSTVVPTTPTTIINPTTLEKSIHEQVNEYRRSQNLPPLKLDSNIIAVARAHSQAMASGRTTFSHDGFEQRVEEISRQIDYRSAGENLAYNFGYQDPGKQAVIGWIKSPGHRKNMEGNFDLTGIGVAQNAKGEYYFTQLFIRRR